MPEFLRDLLREPFFYFFLLLLVGLIAIHEYTQLCWLAACFTWWINAEVADKSAKRWKELTLESMHAMSKIEPILDHYYFLEQTGVITDGMRDSYRKTSASTSEAELQSSASVAAAKLQED